MADIPRYRWRSENVAEITSTARVPAKLQWLFAKPPLLEDEDPKAYQDLRDLVVEAIRPSNVFDWLQVKDVVNSMFEAARLDRVNLGLYQAGRKDAVVQGCAPYGTVASCDVRGQGDLDEAREIGEKWANPDSRKKTEAQLRKRDITRDTILAGSFVLQANSLAAVQSYRTALESRSKRALQEIEARQQRGLADPATEPPESAD
jgi:hypothetical protein